MSMAIMWLAYYGGMPRAMGGPDSSVEGKEYGSPSRRAELGLEGWIRIPQENKEGGQVCQAKETAAYVRREM